MSEGQQGFLHPCTKRSCTRSSDGLEHCVWTDNVAHGLAMSSQPGPHQKGQLGWARREGRRESCRDRIRPESEQMALNQRVVGTMRLRSPTSSQCEARSNSTAEVRAQKGSAMATVEVEAMVCTKRDGQADGLGRVNGEVAALVLLFLCAGAAEAAEAQRNKPPELCVPQL